ncbi:HpaA family protein [Helicobacter equorum]|uniref:Neuraminyllactose-binding hemagglutinin n=3 Tax=Helicobacter TaxID=209 RepID=A0A3D8INU7_9HELI|nr:HpaA family protein [Helicobacter equorum]RDU66605.1 hypothetical protein CQA54_06500 [Helicobacter equorum]
MNRTIFKGVITALGMFTFIGCIGETGGGYTVNKLSETPAKFEYATTQKANKTQGKDIYLSVEGETGALGISNDKFQEALQNLVSEILTNKGYQVSTKSPNFQERKDGYLKMHVYVSMNLTRNVTKEQKVGEKCQTREALRVQLCEAFVTREGTYTGHTNVVIHYNEPLSDVHLDSVKFALDEKMPFHEVAKAQYQKAKANDDLVSSIAGLGGMFSQKEQEGGMLEDDSLKVKGELFNALYQGLGAALEEHISQKEINSFESAVKSIKAKKTY